jgi:hypothetical protein
MDTKTLVIGQEVYMISGSVYAQKGTVVKITPEGVEVQVRIGSWNAYERIYFDNRGYSYATDNPFESPEINGTYEGGPWGLRIFVSEGFDPCWL